jgi:PAS domain S-box-containing protein
MLEFVAHQAIIDAILSPSALVDGAGRIVAVNAAWRRFAEDNGGDVQDYYVGADYVAVCGDPSTVGSAEAPFVAEGLRRVLDGGSGFRCEYPCHSPTEMRWFEVAMSPVRLPEQRLALVIHNDITRRRRAQDEVRRAQDDSSRLAAIVASSADAIISFDHDGIIQTWNAAAAALYGYRTEEAIGRSIEILYPDDSPRFSEIRDRIISGDLGRFEAARRTRWGALRDVAISPATVRAEDGAVVSILGIHRDITEEKATREHLAFITRELSHRSKNLLAIILAVERQTARSAVSLDDFHARFAARLRAMEASLDLLVGRNWERVSLASLARSQLAVFAELGDERLLIEGPDVTLDTAAVEAVGMSLHELATNAMKHGALGSAGGGIRLSWRVEDADKGHGAGRSLAIRWDESSPAISGAPERTGFGHLVVTRLTERKLGAEVGIEFRPGRLCWQAVLPQSHFTVNA